MLFIVLMKISMCGYSDESFWTASLCKALCYAVQSYYSFKITHENNLQCQASVQIKSVMIDKSLVFSPLHAIDPVCHPSFINLLETGVLGVLSALSRTQRQRD